MSKSLPLAAAASPTLFSISPVCLIAKLRVAAIVPAVKRDLHCVQRRCAGDRRVGGPDFWIRNGYHHTLLWLLGPVVRWH